MSKFQKRISEQRLAIILIFPALLVAFSLIIFPLIFSLYASFTSYDILRPNTFRFNYFQNYVKLFHDPVFWGAFVNTIFFIFVALLSELLLGLFTAIMIAKQGRARKIISLLVLIPMMFAPALVGFQFKYLFNDQIGLINNFLWTIGIKKDVAWLVGFLLSRFSILVAEIWVSTPFMTAVLLAGILSLPTEPLEAAEVDGASSWQKLRYVTLPLLFPFILIALTVRSLGISKAFDIVEIMTGGGPAHRTELLWTYAYRKAISEAKFGMGCSISYISMIIGIFISLFLFRQLLKTRGRT